MVGYQSKYRRLVVHIIEIYRSDHGGFDRDWSWLSNEPFSWSWPLKIDFDWMPSLMHKCCRRAKDCGFVKASTSWSAEATWDTRRVPSWTLSRMKWKSIAVYFIQNGKSGWRISRWYQHYHNRLAWVWELKHPTQVIGNQTKEVWKKLQLQHDTLPQLRNLA